MAEDQKKLEGAEIKLTSSNKFLSWLDNFWFHHKWKVIIIAFFAVVLVVGIVQMVNKTDPDVDVTVATHVIYYKEPVDALEKTLLGLLPSDVNGDGKKYVQLNRYKIYSEAEMKAANSKKDENGNPIIECDEAYNKEQMQLYNSYLMTGQGSVLILSEYLYNDLVSRREDDILLTPMSEIFGEDMPEGVMADGYGIRLSKTGAAKNLAGFEFLPSDSVICIMRPFVISGDKGAEKHERAVEYFKTIAEFGN